MTLSVLAGVDTLGLAGATLSLTLGFDTDQVYADVAALPAVLATSDSLTISGASVPTTNGVFSSINDIRFFPTFGGQFFGVPPPGGFAVYDVGAVPLVLGRLTNEVGGVLVGDHVEVSDFGLTPFTTAANPGCNWCASGDVTLEASITDTRYGVSSFSASVSAVPEPATLTLLGLGLAGLALRARRRA